MQLLPPVSACERVLVMLRPCAIEARFSQRVVLVKPGQKHLVVLAVPACRQQDVRATEVDKVELIVCFRPGDLVRASVLSLGDSRSYLLTTARNELGVVYAKSATSGGMPDVHVPD